MPDGHEAAGDRSQLRRAITPAFLTRLVIAISRMKGHEDGGIVLWTGRTPDVREADEVDGYDP